MHRSPNFPALSLEDAIEKVRKIYDFDKRNQASLVSVLKHLGFGEKLSGSAGRVLSAMRQFGLLEETAGKYRVSDLAFKILTLSDASSDRRSAITEVAQKPALYRDLLSEYVDGLPSDTTLKDYLVAEKGFNPASVENFIRAFKETIEFAKLPQGAYNKPEGGGTHKISVGDYVQWESQGALQFDAPKKVTEIADGYVFVEGAATGLPMEQVEKVDAPPVRTPILSNIPGGSSTPRASVLREVSSLQEGEALLQWPSTLSKESVQELEDWLELLIKKLKRRYVDDAK